MTFNPSPHWAHWTVPEFLAALPQKPDEDLTDYHYRLWKLKPSPIKKAYGSQGPTPEQAAFHADRVKKWNKAWRALTKHMKAKAEAEAYRSRYPWVVMANGVQSGPNFSSESMAKEYAKKYFGSDANVQRVEG